jgi:uncharacterized membrane protein
MADDRVPDRILARGVSLGLFLMAFFTLGWTGNTFSGWPPLAAGVVYAAGLFAALLFAVRGIQLIRARPRMPEPVLSAEDADQGRVIGRSFGLIFGAEIVLIVLATLILGLTGQGDYNVPVIALIVGLHFYPLGRVFGRRIDYFIATWVVLVGVAGIVTIAATEVTPPNVWSFVGLGAALGTGAYGVYFLILTSGIMGRLAE